MRIYPLLACVFCLALTSQAAQAQEAAKKDELGTSQEVFAAQGDVVLTQAELDAAINRIPKDYRLQFVRSGERMDQMVASLLRTKVIVAAAKEEAYDQDLLAKGRMALAGEKELAEAWIQRVLETTPEGDYETLAYEVYLANPQDYMAPATLDVSHILLSSEERGEEAGVLAQSLRAQILEDPSLFDGYVMEYSDDPSKEVNGGRFPAMTTGQMVREFENAAFSLTTVGEISEPVKTAYGYHLIRLNGSQPEAVRPFEEVKTVIVDGVKRRTLDEARVRYIRSLLTDPIEVKEDAVENLVKRYYGDNLELAPQLPEN